MTQATAAIESAAGHTDDGNFAAASDDLDDAADHMTRGAYHMHRVASAMIERAGTLDSAGDEARATYAYQMAGAVGAVGGAAGGAATQINAAADAMNAAADARAARAALNAAEIALLPLLKALMAISDVEYTYIDETMTPEYDLGAYPESAEFKRLYPDHIEETINVGHPNYQYELRSIDEDGSVFETDSLIIEYNSDTDESKITFLCTEPDGDRIAYDRGDLAEVMASVCG